MHSVIKDIGYILITGGVIYNLIAAIAVIRFSHASMRLVVSTKAMAFATLLIISGVVALCGWSSISVKALLCLLFVLVTTPVEAHALLRAWHKTQREKNESQHSKLS
ncbi:MAG: monovalent cation/H(+) antiporter subunit G [Endomicrobiales bacterium]